MGRATQRAIEILELIADVDGRWSHAAIARQLGIPKSTLTDLLKDLVQQQYLELGQVGDYLIGPKVLVLSRSYLRRMDVVSRSKDILLRLCIDVDEAASIAVRQGTEIVVVAQERPSKPLVAAMTLGDRAPMIATAAGKAMMAHMDEASVSEIIESSNRIGLKSLKPQSKSSLEAELTRIRAGTMASNVQEWMDGISAIAFPIFAADGPIASIAIAAPENRMNEAWLTTAEPQLKRAADELTTRMGGTPTRVRQS